MRDSVIYDPVKAEGSVTKQISRDLLFESLRHFEVLENAVRTSPLARRAGEGQGGVPGMSRTHGVKVPCPLGREAVQGLANHKGKSQPDDSLKEKLRGISFRRLPYREVAPGGSGSKFHGLRNTNRL